MLLLLGAAMVSVPAHAQISTEPDDSFIQVTPEQQNTLNLKTPKAPKSNLVIRGGKDSYVPAPRTKDAPETVSEATDTGTEEKPKEKDDGKPAAPAVKGHEICDVVAHIIARDFRVIVTNPHFRSLDVPTIGSGPYDVSIKSIVPYSNVYSAMGCDGKRLQTIVAGALKDAAVAAAADKEKKK